MNREPVLSVDVATSKVIKASGGELVAVVLTPAAATATLIIYDNPSTNSGTVLCKLQAAADGGSVQFAPPKSWKASTGIYAAITGTGANATVLYI